MSEEIINVLINSRENQGAGVAVLELQSLNGQPLPGFTAGAHIDVHINEEFVRQYSLSNSPEDKSRYRIGVLNDPNSRGGSSTLFNTFKQGKNVKVSSPRNHFPVQAHSGMAILVAGGIGITPILAMAYELRASARSFEIHYCLRTEGAGAFLEELAREFPDEFTLHCDDNKALNITDTFGNRVGEPHLYTCGPTGFMDWVIAGAKEQGVSEERIHFEYFSAEVDTTGDSFEVYCAISDTTVIVGPEDTIANVLEDAGVDIDVSCEQGICGTCISDILEGEADHRDHFLTDEEKAENKQIAICCSRAKSARLVIDI